MANHFPRPYYKATTFHKTKLIYCFAFLALGVEVPKAEGENREGGGVVGRVGGEGVEEVGDALGGGVRDTGGTVASRLSGLKEFTTSQHFLHNVVYIISEVLTNLKLNKGISINYGIDTERSNPKT